MNHTYKREIYIPIEIKPREFVSQLLLSGELAKKGLRVYLGNKKSLDKLVENKSASNGVYLYKGGGGSISKFKNISKKVESIAVLDQEISPAIIDYNFIRNRFVKGCLKYVSRLYLVGNEAKKAATIVLDDYDSSNIKALGWPRVDLWQPSMNKIWSDQIKNIKKKFPEPFILFTSDFGCNTESLLKQIILRMEKRGAKKTKKEIERYKKIYLQEYKTFLQFIDFLYLLDADPKIPKIIVRPHPNEDHLAWQEKVKNLSKVNVVYEGDVSPWLLASEGLLHRGCTSAIEGAISRKKIGFLKNFAGHHDKALPALLSPKITDLETLKQWLYNENETIDKIPSYYDLLSKHVLFPKEKSASLIAKDLLNLSVIAIAPSHLSKQNNIKLNFKEYILKKIKTKLKKVKLFIGSIISKIYQKPNYIPKFSKKNKMQSGIKLSECAHYLSIMNPKIKYNLLEVSDNLIKIEI